MNTSVMSDELLQSLQFAIVLPGGVQILDCRPMLCSWSYTNRPVKVISVTCLFVYSLDNATEEKLINLTGHVFKICSKH